MDLFRMDLLIELLIFFVFAAGLACLFLEHIRLLRLHWRMRRRLRRAKKRSRQLSPPLRYARRLLQASFQNPPGENVFLLLLALIFLLVMFLALQSFSPGTALLFSGIATSLPVFLLAVRLEIRRKKGSREGLPLVSELHRHYWANHRNIYSAMEATLNGNGTFPVFRKLLFQLLLKLRSTGNPAEIREAVDQFSFSAGTVWARMLGLCIRMASESGTDISLGLQDISSQLSEANTRAEERSRMNSEALRMTVFLVPALYAGTMGIAMYYLGLEPVRLMRNQFATPEGLLFFMIILLFFVINLAVMELLQNQKLDY